ncbi:bacterial regulatory s, tetR family protein [Mycobacterium xenopi 3993]|nr:bacterial regulatory s, tetR family protein [Mycobacterium xenopi 3993]
MSTAAEAARKNRGGTRTSMLVTAAEVLRERGAAGVTIDEVLTRSGAPRGSVYYHFPNGRNQILTEALRYSGEAITAAIDTAADQGAAPWCVASSSCGNICWPRATSMPAVLSWPRRSARQTANRI